MGYVRCIVGYVACSLLAFRCKLTVDEYNKRQVLNICFYFIFCFFAALCWGTLLCFTLNFVLAVFVCGYCRGGAMVVGVSSVQVY